MSNNLRLFDEQISRKPNRYSWTQPFIDAMWQGHWTPNEFNFQADVQNFKVDCTVLERQVMKNTLSAIGQIEIAVKKFWAKMADVLPHPGISDLGFCMANIEVIHNIAYEKLLQTLDLEDVFEENLKLPVIQGRVNYLRKYNKKQYRKSPKEYLYSLTLSKTVKTLNISWIKFKNKDKIIENLKTKLKEQDHNSRKQYIYSLILFTLFVEYVSLFSQFYIVLWFGRYKGYFKDTTQQVHYTMREEELHAEVGIKLVNTLREEYPELFDEDLKNKIIQESLCAFDAESKLIDWMLGGYEGENISAPILKEYVKNRINNALVNIGYDKVFNIDEELLLKTQWMDEEENGNFMTDFFAQTPTDYIKKGKPITEDDLF